MRSSYILVVVTCFLAVSVGCAIAGDTFLPQTPADMERHDPHAAQKQNKTYQLMLETGHYKPRTLEQKQAIRITPTDSKVIKLEQAASSVIVSNPRYAAVVLDTPKVLIISPLQVGASDVTVLNADGDIVWQETVIVTNQTGDYIRVERLCDVAAATSGQDGAAACVEESVYFCPDICYQVDTNTATDNGRP